MNFIEYLFEKSRHSSSPLVVTDTESISHADIWKRVLEISGWIQENAGGSERIGILAENSPFFIQSYAAIIHSGNTAVVIDTKSSPADILNIISRCRIRTVFLDRKYGSRVTGIPGVRLVTPELLPENSSLPEPPCGIPEDGIAVIIFTSGSTGEKKGVMLTHINLIANTGSIIEYLEITANDRMLVVLPFFYCYGASLMHTHIRMGGTLVLSYTPFLGGALRGINQHQCTGFAGVPSTYLILVHRTPFLQMQFPTLKYFTQAGGHLAPSVIEQIANAFPDKKFFVMYGATEATARLSYLPPELLSEKPGSIGRGIPGVTLEIRDDDGNRVGPGEIGEIATYGENIMAGYLDDPEETARVIRNGWYYTGDLATADADGFITIVGRKGTFIKSAGFRVSPLEIEDAILQIGSVAACVVFSVPHPILGEAIIAGILSDAGDESLIADVRDHCSAYLPSHKQPAEYFLLPSLPMNSSGKPDRDVVKNIYLSGGG